MTRDATMAELDELYASLASSGFGSAVLAWSGRLAVALVILLVG